MTESADWVLPISIPNPAPLGPRAAAQAFHSAGRPEVLEDPPEPVDAHPGALALKVGDRERPGRPLDGRLDQAGFLAPPGGRLAHAPLELPRRVQERVEQVVDVRPRVVPPLVPAVRPEL